LKLGRVGEFAVVVAVLAFGKPVLVPVALAFYLAFVLTPPSDWLERLGLPRWASVTAVATAVVVTVAALGSVLVAQASDLVSQMRTYSAQIGEKLSRIQKGHLGAFGDLNASLTELGRVLDRGGRVTSQPAVVRVVSGGLSSFTRLEETIQPIVQPLAVVTIVLVMTLFMLGHREDLRSRLIQLAGPKNVTVTTRTMAEAVNRVSHLLLTQAYINAAFGAVTSLGLYCIGIPYALLWGSIGALMRFVPLVGGLIATLLPTLAAFAIFPGWREVLLTAGFFAGVELLVSNFVEPWVLGKRTGVSALALLVSALFWTWLWGPLGLVLATPLTVCAAVIGRHVPELSFLTVLLGDEVGLNAAVNFYQRVLARATKDAYRFAKRRVTESSLPDTLDELLVPTLGLISSDQNLQAIDDEIAARVGKDLSEILERLSAEHPRPGEWTGPRVVGIPAESEADALLLRMLALTLPGGADALVTVQESSRAAVVTEAVRLNPAVVCIAGVQPSGNVNARFLCRRLRAELPDAYILALAPSADGKQSRELAARLREAGASGVVYGLRDATKTLTEPAAAAPSRAAVATTIA
jgi:predicted PurR-regulated permease PerM